MHKTSRVLISFFDENLNNATFTFSSANQHHSKILNGVPQLSDYATLKDMTSNQRKQGLFSLHESYLVYCESENKRSSAQVLDLTNSRLKPLTPEINSVKHGFVLTKNGTTYQLCFAQRETVDFWIDSLRSICIFSNFHEAYEGVKLLGEGSSGKVFLTESKQDKKLYAVKAFLKQSLTSPSQSDSKALLNEIKILRSLNHPLIVKLHEVYETDHTIYLVTEYHSESKTLQEILSTPKLRNSLSEEDIKKIIYSIFEALSYLASKRIMHRDLKPANILVQAGGNIKLIDFGMAVEVDSDDYIYNRCGTPGYVAPEVFQYDPRDTHTAYDYACDMFSAGCILFYLIFGRPLFHKMDALGQNKLYTDHFIVAILVKEMKKIDCKLTQQGIDLLLKLLEANPKKRVTATECLKNPYFSSQIPSLIKILTLGSKERIEINYPLSSNGDTNSFISLDNTKDSMTSMDDPSDYDEYSDASFAVLFLKK